MSLPLGEAPAVPRDMELYLNRNYWDGHWLGENNPEDAIPQARESGDKLTDKVVEDLSLALSSGVPQALEVYRPGDTFVPEDHEPGTVVIFERETLMQSAPHVNMAALPAELLTRRPAAKLERQLLRQRQLSFEVHHVFGGGMVYEDIVRYGVVALNSRRESRLVTVPSGQIQEISRGTAEEWQSGSFGRIAVEGPRPRTETGPIKVGAVGVHNGKNWNKHRLMRVNALKLINRGEAAA